MGTMPLLFLDALTYIRLAKSQGHVVRAILDYTEEFWNPTARWVQHMGVVTLHLL